MGDRYNPLFELGAGSFGKAWVVRDNKTQKKHVSKVIQIKGLSSEALDSCVTEVAVLSACCHDNIVRYIEAYVCGGALHIVMEYASGGDLQQKIEKQNGVLFTSEMILEWFLQVILALEYIHSKNILHRDLKPQNIFLTDNSVVKLGDFGIARVLNSCDDLASTRIGTPFYISPEICDRKPYNSKSDMWAAGCLLYQMSTLRVPFHASNFDDLSKKIIQARYDPIPSQFHEILKKIISKLLVANPDSRLSASQLLKLESLHGMVMYLKNRNRPKIQGSRTRSSSLVTERSRLNLCPKARSTSANRLGRNSAGGDEVIPGKQHKDKCKDFVGNDKVSSQKTDTCKTNSKGRPEQQYYCKDGNVNKIKGDNAMQANILCEENHFPVDPSVRDSNISSVRDSIIPSVRDSIIPSVRDSSIPSVRGSNIPSVRDSNIPCVRDSNIPSVRDSNIPSVRDSIIPSVKDRNITNVCNETDGIKLIEKSKNQVDTEKKIVINTRTFTIKDSVARKLSEASPKLSETVRKQRLRLSINEPDDVHKIDHGKGCSPGYSDYLRDEVFESPDCKHKHRINSTTYIVKEKEDSDSNNNSMRSDGCIIRSDGCIIKSDGFRVTEAQRKDLINTAMIQALSVYKFNKQFTKKLLHDEIKLKLGDARCEHMINQVRQLIVEDGQSYQTLNAKLNEEELNLIPLVCEDIIYPAYLKAAFLQIYDEIYENLENALNS